MRALLRECLIETVGPQDLNLLFRLHVVLSTELSVLSVYRFVLYDSGTLSVIVSVPCVSLVFVDIYRMEATVMSDEIERERRRSREEIVRFRKTECKMERKSRLRTEISRNVPKVKTLFECARLQASWKNLSDV